MASAGLWKDYMKHSKLGVPPIIVFLCTFEDGAKYDHLCSLAFAHVRVYSGMFENGLTWSGLFDYVLSAALEGCQNMPQHTAQ